MILRKNMEKPYTEKLAKLVYNVIKWGAILLLAVFVLGLIMYLSL
jgi:hypothetical protein